MIAAKRRSPHARNCPQFRGRSMATDAPCQQCRRKGPVENRGRSSAASFHDLPPLRSEIAPFAEPNDQTSIRSTSVLFALAATLRRSKRFPVSGSVTRTVYAPAAKTGGVHASDGRRSI